MTTIELILIIRCWIRLKLKFRQHHARYLSLHHMTVTTTMSASHSLLYLPILSRGYKNPLFYTIPRGLVSHLHMCILCILRLKPPINRSLAHSRRRQQEAIHLILLSWTTLSIDYAYRRVLCLNNEEKSRSRWQFRVIDIFPLMWWLLGRRGIGLLSELIDIEGECAVLSPDPRV